jgi:hypothetical protein
MKRIEGPGARLKAYEDDRGSEIVLLTPGGRVLGRFLKATGITIDSGGKLIGYGNQLMTLLSEK